MYISLNFSWIGQNNHLPLCDEPDVHSLLGLGAAERAPTKQAKLQPQVKKRCLAAVGPTCQANRRGILWSGTSGCRIVWPACSRTTGIGGLFRLRASVVARLCWRLRHELVSVASRNERWLYEEPRINNYQNVNFYLWTGFRNSTWIPDSLYGFDFFLILPVINNLICLISQSYPNLRWFNKN